MFWKRTKQSRSRIEDCWWRVWGWSQKFWFGEINMILASLSEINLKISAFSLSIINFHFSFFLEKNMLSYFLQIMRQKSGGCSNICVQLLQTLNILFENIRIEASLCKIIIWPSWTLTFLTNFRKKLLKFPNVTILKWSMLMMVFKTFRLPSQQQSRELHNSPQVWLFWWGRDGILHIVPQNAQFKAKCSHHTLFLQWTHERLSSVHRGHKVLQPSRGDGQNSR